MATAVFLALTACHGRPAEDVELADETTVTAESDEHEERMLEEQRRLTSELDALKKQQAFLKQQIGEQEGTIAQSEDRIGRLKDDLKQKKAQTHAYIDRHQLPVACAYASQVARGEGEYSEKTRKCAELVSVYCAVAMVSPRFRRKVAAVRQHVEAAESEAQSLKEQISSEQKKLDATRAELQATEVSIDRVAGDIATSRQKILAHGWAVDGGL